MLCFLFLIIIFYSKNLFIRGFLGDVVIISFFVFGIKTFFPIKLFKISIFVLLFAFFVEFTQYFKVLKFLQIQENLFTKIIFGSTFDPFDLVAYFIGFIISILLGKFIIEK